MSTYRITEKQDTSSSRGGYLYEAKDLAAAKRKATKQQAFYGTVLEVSLVNPKTSEDPDTDTVMSYKINGKWEDTSNA